MAAQLAQFIVYACPLGELGQQLERYLTHSRSRCGANAAHRYMPHCTLTGFFRDDVAAIPVYLEAIAHTLQALPPPTPVATISRMTLRPDWHGLEVQSEWLLSFTRQFAQVARSPSRPEPLRLKTWLHVSLAYEFPPAQARPLRQLAEQWVDPQAPVHWALRFYQRRADDTWMCHQQWILGA